MQYSFNQYFQIGATEAGYPNLAVLRTATKFKGYASGGRNLTLPVSEEKMEGHLVSLNASLLTANYDTRHGTLLDLVSLQDRAIMTSLGCKRYLSLLNPIISWQGKIPVAYGFGVCSWNYLTATDIIRIQGTVEV